jgi:hypothetical protein
LCLCEELPTDAILMSAKNLILLWNTTHEV